MATFIITKHAEQRMKERNIAYPLWKDLASAGKKTKRYIKKKCAEHGFKDNYIYFRNVQSVFICAPLEPGTYVIVTAFNVESD